MHTIISLFPFFYYTYVFSLQWRLNATIRNTIEFIKHLREKTTHSTDCTSRNAHSRDSRCSYLRTSSFFFLFVRLLLFLFIFTVTALLFGALQSTHPNYCTDLIENIIRNQGDDANAEKKTRSPRTSNRKEHPRIVDECIYSILFTFSLPFAPLCRSSRMLALMNGTTGCAYSHVHLCSVEVHARR